jgi:hypothetical protein
MEVELSSVTVLLMANRPRATHLKMIAIQKASSNVSSVVTESANDEVGHC